MSEVEKQLIASSGSWIPTYPNTTQEWWRTNSNSVCKYFDDVNAAQLRLGVFYKRFRSIVCSLILLGGLEKRLEKKQNIWEKSIEYSFVSSVIKSCYFFWATTDLITDVSIKSATWAERLYCCDYGWYVPKTQRRLQGPYQIKTRPFNLCLCCFDVQYGSKHNMGPGQLVKWTI